jgi:urease subunit alpha
MPAARALGVEGVNGAALEGLDRVLDEARFVERVGVGRALHGSSYTFVSEAALAGGLARKLKVERSLVAVENTRGRIGKKSMIHNGATPKIEIDPETYDVRADGELLVCEPADKLPMAQRYFLF